MSLRLLSHHDREDAQQDAWVAALEKGRTDPPYLRGCERICAIEVMRQNDRWSDKLRAWADSNVHTSSRGEERVDVQFTEHLIPMRHFPGEVLYGEDYRAQRRAYERRRRACRSALVGQIS